MLRNSNHLKRVLISKYTTPTGCGGIFSVCQKSLYSTAPGKFCISRKNPKFESPLIFIINRFRDWKQRNKNQRKDPW